MQGNSTRLKDALDPAIPSLWELLAYAVVAAVLIWLTFRIRAWFRDDDAGTGHSNDLLTDLRELHRQGGLSDEEFRLIKTQLVGERPAKSGGSPAAAKVAERLAQPVTDSQDSKTDAAQL